MRHDGVLQGSEVARTIAALPDIDGLMTEFASERKQRFDALFAAHGSDIVAYCGWRAISPSDAQDAVADVFLIAWRRLDDIPVGDTARIWLYATARRVLANQRRSIRRREALHERLALEAAAAPSERASDDCTELVVHQALRGLSARDREVLLLAEWEGLSAEEIAVVLGSLAVTVRGRLHRARRRFRAIYEELHAADSGKPQRLESVFTPVSIREGGP
jgi:RNA polymerase sigma factor (sigma-70 family)